MRIENKKIQEFLNENGINARARYLFVGSQKKRWVLYNYKLKWDLNLCQKLTELGFTNFDGNPLNEFSGNGGLFSVTVKGHDEFVECEK